MFTIKQSGVSLIAALFIIVILGFMGAMLVSTVNTAGLSAINDLQSTQALYAAEGGEEYAKYNFENGVLCNALNYNNVSLGNGTFTTAGQRYQPVGANILGTSAAVNATDTVIPLSADPVAAGYAPQGRIRIEDEEISYSGISGNSFTGVLRGAAGTTAVAHNTIGVQVLQDQCRIQSTGQAGGAERTVLVDVPGYASAGVAASLDGSSVAVGTAETNIGKLQTELVNGDNLIVVVASFQNLTGNKRTITAGNLRLYRGTTQLTQNVNAFSVGGTTTPGFNNFPQATQFFVYKDPLASSGTCPTYNVTARASGTGVSAQVKIAVFNGAAYSSSLDDLTNQSLSNTVDTAFDSLPTTLSLNDNAIIIAAVQLDNRTTGTRYVNQGLLKLKNGSGTTISSNQFRINLERSGRVNYDAGYLLIGNETVSSNNPTYTVTGTGDTNNGINAVAKMLVFKGFSSAFIHNNTVPISTTATSLGSLNTTFTAGDNMIFGTQQYANTSGGVRNIPAGSESIVYNSVSQTAPQYAVYLARSGTTYASGFATGLIWLQTGAPAAPSFDVEAAANNAGINGETKNLAIHLNIIAIPSYGWREEFN